MKNRNQHQGFSLVELMISMVLGLILTAGVITLFISSQKTYRTLQQLSEQQENVNFAFRFIEDQVLNIDYLGDCDAGMPVANAVKKGGAAYDADAVAGPAGNIQ